MRYLSIVLLIVLASCGKASQKKHPSVPETGSINSLSDSLRSLDVRLDPAQPGDWLFAHNEKGQTFEEFQSFAPIKKDSIRRYLYLQPLGNFTEFESTIIQKLSGYLACFFLTPVKTLTPLSDKMINNNAIRFSSEGNQVLTPYILDSIVAPRLPEDAIMMMALTNLDLYTGPNNNFVFGQARFQQRIAVSSFQRFVYDTTYCLQRIMKTASHETGHTLGIKHCTYARCLMNGSNSLTELDLRPFHLCSQCLKKLEWSIQLDIKSRFVSLEGFYSVQGLKDESVFMHKSLDAIGLPKH